MTRRCQRTSTTGGNANGESTFCEISRNGRYVTFSSLATTSSRAAPRSGVFVRDMFNPNPATATQHVETGSDRPVISDDASLIAYNRVGVRNDIYVEERVGGRQLQVTDNPNPGTDVESLRPEISGDGNFLIFASDLQLVAEDTNTERDVYLRDLRPWRAGGSDAGPPRLVSVARDGLAAGTSSSRPGINANGSVVSFQSADGNLVAGDTNGEMDAFVRDYRTNAAGVTVHRQLQP